MCGIIGIVGKEQVAERLVDGLRRMEYRGYDSAGVCTVHDGQLIRRRAPGKLNNLVRELVRDPAPGTTGIAHTLSLIHI
jgi:glucosamine--fructose-6-phosphate aminotransferase (isomerizing)